MVIFDTPISLREIHYTIFWYFKECIQLKRLTSEKAVFNFVYFSYKPDFLFLKLSISTLIKNIPPSLLQNIFVVVDQKDPFTAKQESDLIKLYKNITFFPIYNFSWGSAISTYEEIQIFKLLGNKLKNEYDYLVKVDSDILFLPTEKWHKMSLWKKSSVGDGHYLKFRYAQGGLYLLTKYIIENSLNTVTIDEIEKVNRITGTVGEDMAISELFRQIKSAFFFTRLMLFPDEYQRINKINRWSNNGFVAMHFHKDKARMLDFANKFKLN